MLLGGLRPNVARANEREIKHEAKERKGNHLLAGQEMHAMAQAKGQLRWAQAGRKKQSSRRQPRPGFAVIQREENCVVKPPRGAGITQMFLQERLLTSNPPSSSDANSDKAQEKFPDNGDN